MAPATNNGMQPASLRPLLSGKVVMPYRTTTENQPSTHALKKTSGTHKEVRTIWERRR